MEYTHFLVCPHFPFSDISRSFRPSLDTDASAAPVSKVNQGDRATRCWVLSFNMWRLNCAAKDAELIGMERHPARSVSLAAEESERLPQSPIVLEINASCMLKFHVLSPLSDPKYAAGWLSVNLRIFLVCEQKLSVTANAALGKVLWPIPELWTNTLLCGKHSRTHVDIAAPCYRILEVPPCTIASGSGECFTFYQPFS